VLHVSLPAELEIGWGSVTFVVNGELIVLTDFKQVVRWKIETETHFCCSDTDRAWWSYCPPLIVGTYVYVANRLEKWSLDMQGFDPLLAKPVSF